MNEDESIEIETEDATPILGVDYLTPTKFNDIKKSLKPIAGIDYEIPTTSTVDEASIIKKLSSKLPKVKEIDKTAIVSEVLSKSGTWIMVATSVANGNFLAFM